jgi:hypothetical protein
LAGSNWFAIVEVVDQRVSLKGYQGTLRQVLILDLGHDEPTILLTDDKNCKLKPIITRYARRMLVKNGLSDAVDFFHLDVLSSAVALNVDFDVLLTVLGSGIYRMFARMLHGYERAQARQIFRRFLDTSAPRHGVPEGSHRTTPTANSQSALDRFRLDRARHSDSMVAWPYPTHPDPVNKDRCVLSER